MNRELILHIGLTKTGSTSIQRVLAANREKLAEQGVYLPTSPGRVVHTLLPASLADDLNSFGPAFWGAALPPATRLAAFREAFAAEMAALPDWATRCIITTELISARLFSEGEIDRLAALLSPLFARIQVVVYLRRQDQHAASNYNELLRAGLARGPGLPEQIKLLNYDGMLARFARVFGESAMVPRIFAREDLVNGDVVDDFLHVTGLKLPPEAGERARESITWEGQQLLLGVSRFLDRKDGAGEWQGSLAWLHLVRAVGQSLPGPGWRPTRKEATDFMAKFAETNARVCAKYFPGRESLFNQDFSSLPTEPMKPDPARVMEAALAVLVDQADERSERDAAACMAQYRLLKRLGDEPGMRTMLTRAIRHAPDLLLPRLRMTELCIASGDTREARDHAEAAVRINPTSRAAKLLMSQVS